MKPKHTENTTERAAPKALVLMRHYGISKRGVARQLGKDITTVRRALSPKTFRNVTHQHLYPVRTRVTHLLIASGWNGNPDDLWKEYDEQLAA